MLFKLFKTFFKIGAFTIGGGYAMISLVKEECVEKNSWLSESEFLNLVAVAESTPGPIAINMATYVGYKVSKMKGAIVSTIAIIIPSISIIYIISLFFRDILKYKLVSDAFFGIRIAVAIIIIRTAYNLVKNEYINANRKKLTLSLFFIYLFLVIVTSLTNINISNTIFILSSIVLGVIFA